MTKHIHQDYRNPVSFETRSLRCMIGHKVAQYTLSVKTFEDVLHVLRTDDRHEALAHWQRCATRLQSAGFEVDGSRIDKQKVSS